MDSSRLDKAIEKIRGDHLSGAQVLSRRCAEVLNEFVPSADFSSIASLLSQLEEVGRRLIAAQPSMAPIYNLVEGALQEVRRTRELREAKAALKKYLSAYLEGDSQKQSKINLELLSLVNDGDLILTYSYSSTVLKGLIYLKEKGKSFSVLTPESRPQQEGVRLARALTQAGMKVTLMVDSAVCHFLPQVNLIIIGADSITPHGVVNKIGSYPLAILARRWRIPFYVVCFSEKLVLHSLDYRPIISLQDPREIVSEPLPGVEVKNIYFDFTPLELITKVITDRGVFTGEDLLRLSDKEIKGNEKRR